MGSGTYERQGNYLSTGSSGGYTFVRFPNGESFNESTGKTTLYFETGFYCNSGNFYGANFHSDGSTVENFQVLKHPKFEVYVDKAGEFRFRLKAKNGQIIATGEGYKRKDSCLNGIESVRKNAPEAPIEKEE